MTMNRDYIQLNKEIAYKGLVGRIREEFCKRYIGHKRSIITRIEQSVNQQIAADENITCKRGCFYCCSQHIGCSIGECEAIVYFLYQHDTVLKQFVNSYPDWRSKVRQNEPLFKKIPQLFMNVVNSGVQIEKQKAFMKVAREYERLDIACPFLANGECSIYEVRPFVCAGIVATTPADYCRPSSPNTPKVYFNLSGAILDRQMPYYRKIER